MSDKEPTDTQLKEFWEWCGLQYEIDEDEYKVMLPDGDWYNFGHDADIKPSWEEIEPPIDLNNLFEYAVPKLVPESGQGGVEFRFYPGGTSCIITGEDEVGFNETEYFLECKRDPALALFWAIWEVIYE